MLAHGARILLVTILAGVAPVGFAQTITDYVKCLNDKLSKKENLESGDVNNVNISDSVQCLPQGCKITLNLSPLSAQKGGISSPQEGVTVQLPHVMLNCPGPDKGLRVRPAYTLLPQGPPSSSVETGEDTGPPVQVTSGASSFLLRKLVMSDLAIGRIRIAGNDVDFLPPYSADGSVETPTNPKRCASCHNSGLVDPGTKAYGPNNINAQLSFENDPFGVVRKDVGFSNALPYLIYTTEPNRKNAVKPGAGMKAQSLASVCTDIKNNLALFADNTKPNDKLCDKLAAYEKNNGCGTGKAGLKDRLCMGVSGGGTFKSDTNDISSVAVDFSGQATNDGTNISFLDWDGTLNAVNYTKHISIATLQLSDLTGVKAATGFVLTANGTAQYSKDGGAAAAKKVRVTMDIGKKTIKITDSDNGDAVLVDAKTGLIGAILNLNTN